MTECHDGENCIRPLNSAQGAIALMTLGGQAQVVTFALDALLAQGEQLDAVMVIHMATDRPRVHRALQQLNAEFADGTYAGRTLTLSHRTVMGDEGPLAEIADAHAAEAAWRWGRDLLATLKRQGHTLHLCVSGGPRILALTLTSAAALYCDHHDRLWHLYTPRTFMEMARDGAILHAPPKAGVRLLPVPLVPWGAYFPALRTLTQHSGETPLSPQDAAACEAVWKHLTQRQQDVVRALATGALPQEVAEELGISLATFNSHRTQILAECRIAWALPEDDTTLTYHFIREKFGPWLALRSN